MKFFHVYNEEYFEGLVKMMVNSDVLHITGKSSEDWRYAHL